MLAHSCYAPGCYQSERAPCLALAPSLSNCASRRLPQEPTCTPTARDARLLSSRRFGLLPPEMWAACGVAGARAPRRSAHAACVARLASSSLPSLPPLLVSASTRIVMLCRATTLFSSSSTPCVQQQLHRLWPTQRLSQCLVHPCAAPIRMYAEPGCIAICTERRSAFEPRSMLSVHASPRKSASHGSSDHATVAMPSSHRSRRSKWLASFCAQPILVSCRVSGVSARHSPAPPKTWRSRSPTIRSSSARSPPSGHMCVPPTTPSARR
mmetsp:Transcript_195/g.532  ORF Transcript_195/g.532 Transcript_195/m.532 type:complete len:268 (-) Transcript_195:79-882(-)